MRYGIGMFVCAVALAASAGAETRCDLGAAIGEGREKLLKITPKVRGTASYRSVVFLPGGREEKLPKVQTGYAYREVPLAVLDRYACTVEVVRPWHEVRDGRLTEPLGVPGLHLEAHLGAIDWNWSNTSFTFDDERYVVVGELWKPYGKKAVLTVPYSLRLHLAYPDAVLRGSARFDEIFSRAFAKLEAFGYVGKDTRDRRYRRMRHYVRVEHIDQEEFVLAGEATKRLLIDKAFAQLDYEGDQAFMRRKSSAGAVGAVQIEPKTCKGLRSDFPKVGFAPGCNGAKDLTAQEANVAAGILVDQEKEGQLAAIFGEEVYGTPWGDLVAGASYNAGTVRPRKAVEYAREHGGDWSAVRFDAKGNLRPDSLRRETSIYVAKIRYVLAADEAQGTIATLSGGGAR